MQTFLPYPSYIQSAQCLDRQRLGNQRVECLQILNALTNPAYGWQSHPAVAMWRGYEECLQLYSVTICDEWIARSYRDTCKDKILAFNFEPGPTYPHWLGNPAFHRSHQSNLIRKLPEHYGALWPNVPNDLEYIWPNGAN